MRSNTPTERKRRYRRPTQNQTLKCAFEASPGEKLALPDLVGLTGAYAIHSRVADLRRRYGMKIVNKIAHIERNGELVPCSFYTYLPEPKEE